MPGGQFRQRAPPVVPETGRHDTQYTCEAHRRPAAQPKPSRQVDTTGTESPGTDGCTTRNHSPSERPNRNRHPSRKSGNRTAYHQNSGRHRDRLADQTNKPEPVPASHTTPDRQTGSIPTAALSACRPDAPTVRRTYLRYFLTSSMWRRLRLWYSLYTI